MIAATCLRTSSLLTGLVFKTICVLTNAYSALYKVGNHRQTDRQTCTYRLHKQASKHTSTEKLTGYQHDTFLKGIE